VTFRFNPSGARKFGDYTAENIGSPLRHRARRRGDLGPGDPEHIPGGSGIITGNFTVEESTELAVLLRAGALPAEMDLPRGTHHRAGTGRRTASRPGKMADARRLRAVLVFMALSYGWFGLFANVALILNVGLIFGLLSRLIGATLTLPGIAGIVLTIGMAVDANVLVFERIREELKHGRRARRAPSSWAMKRRCRRSSTPTSPPSSPRDPVRHGLRPGAGFAVTLGFGILTSVFTAIFVTRLMIVMWFERRRPKTIEV
jgi:preprotein translocase subunit SecD